MKDPSNSQMPAAEKRTALVVGHPGHELLVYGWLEETRPLVFVLTDGSGRSNKSRLVSTTSVIEQTGAKAGNIYGRLTDRAAYAAILNHKFELFTGLASELCEALVAEQIDFVAGDAFEGYNPMHDVCRLVINAAVTAAWLTRAHRVENFEFSLVDRPDARRDHNGFYRLLDEAAFARKLKAAEGYAELSGEVLAALERVSLDAFRVEYLHRIDARKANHQSAGQPFYEQYGEKQVAAGYYAQAIRYREHIAPLAAALKSFAEG